MNGEVKIYGRYLNFFFVGIAVEGSRLISFWLFAKIMSPELANVLSLPVNVLIGFLLFGRFTWRDRTGSWLGKLVRFGGGKGFTYLFKAIAFPFWRALIPCPLYELTHLIVDLLPSTLVSSFMHTLFDCNWMSLATMDFVLAMTLGFIINDKFVFWKK